MNPPGQFIWVGKFVILSVQVLSGPFGKKLSYPAVVCKIQNAHQLNGNIIYLQKFPLKQAIVCKNVTVENWFFIDPKLLLG